MIPRTIFGGDVVLVAKSGDQVAGFSSVLFDSPQSVFKDNSYPNTKGNYLSGVAIAERYKKQGLYRQMVSTTIEEGLNRQLSLVFTRTQNPIIEQGIVHELKSRQNRGEISEFETERRVIENCYGEMLTKDVPPVVGDQDLQAQYEKLRRDKGDAFVILFHLSRPRT